MPDDDPQDDSELPVDPGVAITTGDVGDPAKVRRRRIKQATAEEQIEIENAAVWQSMLSTKPGRRVVWELLNTTLHYRDTRFATSGQLATPQPEATWFELGKQQAGTDIFISLLQFDRDGVYLMLDENDPRFSRDKRNRGNRLDGRRAS